MYTALVQIKKRSGDVVAFDPEKIMQAVRAAYLQVYGGPNEALVQSVVQRVVQSMDATFSDRMPGVEDVQNAVERELMAAEQFDVAKSYIIYRYEHTKIREEQKAEVLKKIEKQGLTIIKRSGQKELFSVDKLASSLKLLLGELAQDIDVAMVVAQVQLEVHEDMSTSDIERAIIMVLRSFIERDPAYSYGAARALLMRLYKGILGTEQVKYDQLEEQLQGVFPRSIERGVSVGRLDARLLTFDLRRLAGELVVENDHLFHYLAAQTLADRYLVKDIQSKDILETPQFFWMRVAMGVALKEDKKEERAIEFYHMMSKLRYVPSSPTLFNAGMIHSQLSSCFLNTVPDDLHLIFKSYSDNAQLLKYTGGCGTDWTPVRGTGAVIKTTAVESQGVIPFLKIANDTTISINRSGRRRGAACVYLESWHWDVEEFLELRKNTGDERRRTHDINTANWIPDLLMQRIQADGMWSLFSPNEVPDLHDLYGAAFKKRYEQYEAKGLAGELQLFRQVKAKDLWKKMLSMLFETGHAWITFKDPSNVRSPQDHAGVVHSSNLCTEITLNTSADETAVCNLGSVNLARHIRDGKLDLAAIAETVAVGMRMLDNVIDINFYPTVDAQRSNMRHRPVGLGIMGFHDALYQIGVNFDSEAMVEFADSSMEAVSYNAILASSKLARERGAYSSYRGSKWDRGLLPQDTIALLEVERGQKIDVKAGGKLDWEPVRKHIAEWGMRNSNCLAIAPTATISNISGAIPSIEPIYKNIYVKANISGDFVVVNEYLVKDLKKAGLWNDALLTQLKFNDGKLANIESIPQELKAKYKEVFEVDPKWLIRAAAYRGKWIDQSQSMNIFYSGTSGKDINDIYMYAWEMGLKTTYYLRTLAASQVEKSTVNTTEFGATHTRDNSAPLSQQAVPTVLPQAQPVEAVMGVLEALAAESKPDPVPVVQVAAAVQVRAEIGQQQAAATQPILPNTPPSSQSGVLGAMPSAPAQASGEYTNETVVIDGKVWKACKINDPDCEACQ